jgi:hypothetical protein
MSLSSIVSEMYAGIAKNLGLSDTVVLVVITSFGSPIISLNEFYVLN